MRLTSLRLQNIRCLTDCRIALDDVTLILGPNGSGKSTIAEAIRYALTGECGLTDGRGAGIARSIRHGAKSGSIDVATDGPTVMRSITAKGATVAVDKLAGEEARAAIEVALPSPELLRCMLSSGHFVGLPPKEQQSVLSSLAGQPVDADWVRGQLSDAQAGAIAQALDTTNLTGPALLDHVHSAAYGARTERNRRVKATAAALTGDAPQAADEALLAQLETALGKAAQRLADAQQKLGAAQAQIDAHAKAKAAAEEAGSKLTRAREELRLLVVPDAPSDEALEALQQQVQAADEALRQAKSDADRMAGKAMALDDQLAEFSPRGDKCAVLSTITCPLSADDRAHAASMAKAEHAEAVAEAKRLSAEVATARETLEELKRQAEEANAQRTAAATAAKRHADLTADVERLSEANAAAVEAYQKTPAADRETLQGLVAEAEEAHKRADTALRAEQDSKREAEEWAKREAEHAKAVAEAEVMDSVVKALAPGGLPAKAMEETVGTIVEAVNRVLSEYTEFALAIEPGADFELAVLSGGYRTPVVLLSESERLRVGVALQVAFAHLTGFGFIVVDAADRLDTANRAPMIRMLLGSGAQALVTATPLNGGRPVLEGLAVYDLADGTAQRYVAPIEEG